MPLDIAGKRLANIVGIAAKPICKAVTTERIEADVRRWKHRPAEIVQKGEARIRLGDRAKTVVEFLELAAMCFEQGADRIALGPEIDAAFAHLQTTARFRQRDAPKPVEPFKQLDLASAHAMRLKSGENSGQAAPDNSDARHKRCHARSAKAFGKINIAVLLFGAHGQTGRAKA